MWVFSPDFSQVSKVRRRVGRLNAGQDGAWWMAVNHVLLTEFHHQQRRTPYFLEYTKKFTDAPYLVELVRRTDGVARPGQLLRAGRLEKIRRREHGEWKFLMWDETAAVRKMPMGSSGSAGARPKGKWNLQLKDGKDGSEISPALTFLDERRRRASRARRLWHKAMRLHARRPGQGP